jgi:chromosome segregation ATPase
MLQLTTSKEELSIRYEALSKATEIEIKQLQNELDSSKLASDVFFDNERRLMAQQLGSVTQERDSLIEELKSEKTSLFKVEQIRKVNKMEFDDKISTMHKEISELYCLVEELKLDIEKKQKEIASHEDDLVAEQENCASLLIENEELATKLKGVEEKLEQKTASSDLEVSSLKLAHEKEIQQLQASLDVEKANKVQLQEKFNNLSSISALETQDQELQRLTILMDAITKELGEKEQQLNSAISQLKRREGEAAGVMAAVDDMRIENEQLRTEYETLEKMHRSESKAAQENERALRASERDLKAKEQEVLSLKRILLAFESSSDSIHAEHHLLSTPNGAVDAKYASRPNGVTRPVSMPMEELPNPVPVPVAMPSFTLAAVKPQKDGLALHSDAADITDSTSKAGKAIREVSPIIKQAAQLNTELLKEVGSTYRSFQISSFA